jgi:hypothetical protein
MILPRFVDESGFGTSTTAVGGFKFFSQQGTDGWRSMVRISNKFVLVFYLSKEKDSSSACLNHLPFLLYA